MEIGLVKLAEMQEQKALAFSVGLHVKGKLKFSLFLWKQKAPSRFVNLLAGTEFDSPR